MKIFIPTPQDLEKYNYEDVDLFLKTIAEVLSDPEKRSRCRKEKEKENEFSIGVPGVFKQAVIDKATRELRRSGWCVVSTWPVNNGTRYLDVHLQPLQKKKITKKKVK